MSYEILKRYAEIDRLLRKKSTGTREELAEKIGVSVRSLYRYRDCLERFGAVIAFDTQLQSYYYEKEPFQLFVDPICERQLNKALF